MISNPEVIFTINGRREMVNNLIFASCGGVGEGSKGVWDLRGDKSSGGGRSLEDPHPKRHSNGRYGMKSGGHPY